MTEVRSSNNDDEQFQTPQSRELFAELKQLVSRKEVSKDGPEPIRVPTAEEISAQLRTLPRREVTEAVPGRFVAEIPKDASSEAAIPEYLQSMNERMLWTQLYSERAHTADPFEGGVSEQILYGKQDYLTILNTAEALSDEEFARIKAGLDKVEKVVGERLFTAVPRIVINDKFKQSRYTDDPDYVVFGRAWDQIACIELNSRVLGIDSKTTGPLNNKLDAFNLPPGIVSSRIELVVIHEVGHLLDLAARGRDFGTALGWKTDEETGDGELGPLPICTMVDTSEGPKAIPYDEIYTKDDIDRSAPPTEYAHINQYEDFAESFVLLVLAPEKLDPIRRDELIQQINRVPLMDGTVEDMQTHLEDKESKSRVRRDTSEDVEVLTPTLPKELLYRRVG